MEPKDIYILVGCEESQAITIAFRKLGFQAFSCDIKACSGGHPEWHIHGDVFKAIKGGTIILENGTMIINFDKWDAAIFHPECTYLTVSGLHWNKKNPERAQKTERSLEFVRNLMNCGIENIAIENPVGCISTRIFKYIGGENGSERWEVFPRKLDHGARKPDQTIQPYQFGDDASKATCLWLTGFPKLTFTKDQYCEPRILPNGLKRWANQTDDGQNKLLIDGKWIGYNDPRTKTYRSKTYPGIASAISKQWGDYLLSL